MSSSNTTAKIAPDHVPEELIWPHKLDEFTAQLDDPFLAAARLHDEVPDIFWAEEAGLGKPGWVLTRDDLIREAYMDIEHFSSTRNDKSADVIGQDMVRMIPVEVDPPEHAQYRKILNPLFTPKHVLEYGDMVQQTCDRLIDGIADPANCEFISEFAEQFPNSIFLALAGLPQEELPQFLEWERQLLRSGTEGDYEKSTEAAKLIFMYLYEFISKEKENPNRTEFIDTLLKGTVEDRPLDDTEILGYLFLFYVAGLDTVYSTLGWIFRHIAMDQSLQSHLRAHPEDIKNAVEEFTRAFSVPAPNRRVAKDFEFHGVKMRENDPVLLPLYLAGRDPRAYAEPHKIDINRRARHLAFATGPHMCLGIHLAKRELRIALESFLSRFSSIRLKEGGEYKFHTGGVLGVDSLYLEMELA